MMYPARPGLVFGFHGCDSSVKKAVILNETTLAPSKNDYDWLGHGIYFWENNQKRAIQFAIELQKQIRVSNSAILQPDTLGAVIDMGYCLDLMDSENLALLKDSYKNFKHSYTLEGKVLPKNKFTLNSNDRLIRDLDCAVIENLHKRMILESVKPFDTIRSAFTEGDELYPSAGFHDKNHIQICVRNPNCIKAYFNPRKADTRWVVP